LFFGINGYETQAKPNIQGQQAVEEQQSISAGPIDLKMSSKMWLGDK